MVKPRWDTLSGTQLLEGLKTILENSTSWKVKFEVWPNDKPAIFKKKEKKIVIILGFVQAMNTIITMNTFETNEA